MPDGRVRVFATGRDGIISAVFNPDLNSAPAIEAGNRIGRGTAAIVADPAVIIR